MTQSTAEQRAESARLLALHTSGVGWWSDDVADSLLALLPALLADAGALADGVTFSAPERDELKGIVCDWLDDGFTVPPYSSELYRVVAKLGIRQEDVQQYDITPPAPKGTADGCGK